MSKKDKDNEDAQVNTSDNIEVKESRKDDYHNLVQDFDSITNRAKESYQEKAPGREIDFSSIIMHSRSGVICRTDDKGIPVITVSGDEVDNRGHHRTQRLFIGLQSEVGTKGRSQASNNLAERETMVKEFEVTARAHELIKTAITKAQKEGESLQRKIDEENYEWFESFKAPGQVVSIYADTEEPLPLDLVTELVVAARQTVREQLGAKVDKLETAFTKWADHYEYADSEGNKYDAVIPRLSLTVYVKTKDGSEAFGSIRGAMGGLDVLKRHENYNSYVDAAKALGSEVAKEAIELDRAQGTSILGNECPVILSSEVAGVLAHEAFGHPLEGDIVCDNRRNKSAKVTLKSRLGSQVSDNPAFTIIDTGSAEIKFGNRVIKYGFGSIPIDERGNTAKDTVLVQKGIQINVMTDRFTINEIVDGLKEDIAEHILKHGLSGNVRREKFDCPPLVRMRNTFIQPDPKGPKGLGEMAALLPKNKKGVYIKTCQGGWVNPDSGEFMVNGNLCYLIENGTVTEKPVKGVHLTGNISKYVDAIKSIGSAETMIRTFSGYCGKDNQIVCVEGGGPLIYLENAKLASGSSAFFSKAREQYFQQIEQRRAGIRSDISIPEVKEISDISDQSHLCMVTAMLPLENEIDLITGARDYAEYEFCNGEMKRKDSIY